MMSEDEEKRRKEKMMMLEDDDDYFWEKAGELAETYCSSSNPLPLTTNTQQPLLPLQPLLQPLTSPSPFFHPPPCITHSPPKLLSQIPPDHEINRLKDELGRLSKVLANLEQECLELRQHNLRPVLPLNGSQTLKNKDPSKGVIPCKAVGVQTDGHALSTDATVKKSSSVSRQLVGIWEPQNDQVPRTNLVSKLFVACEADLQVLFGFLGFNIPSKKTTAKVVPSHCIQSAEAAKVSHLYLTLTKISYDTGKLGDLLEALVDLCGLQNVVIVYRSLCVLHVVLKHILNMENNLSCRDPSTSNPRLLTSAKNKDGSRNESQPLISSSKWFSLFQTMHQVATRQCEESIKVEAVSIMNILLLRTDAYTEREMYGEVSIFQSISQLLKKEAGVGVKKQAVHSLYLLLNCPKLLVMFCSSSNEGTSGEDAENGHTFEGLGSVLDGLADCLACHGNGASTNLHPLGEVALNFCWDVIFREGPTFFT